MRRWIVYAAVLAVLAISPLQGMDIGTLSPARTVWLAEHNGQIYMQTDAGDFGVGADVQGALDDLNASASCQVFLETADYLIIEKGREVLLTQAVAVFRPACRICTADKMPDMESATDFLRVHKPVTTLRQWRVEKNQLQLLQEQNGRFCWDEE